MDYRIFPPEELPEAIISLPLSKSISNRALILNALAGGHGSLGRVAECDDTDVMLAALDSYFSRQNESSSGAELELSVGAAGTAMRFLTAFFASQDGCVVTLDGSDRMRRRPIAPLVDAHRM